MLPQEIIIKKREAETLTPEEITFFVEGITHGGVTDAQVSALAMAVCLNGMNIAERVALTEAMRDSGTVLRWDLPGPVVDKHSTGGVGDNISLMLGPALAACGAYVPMISGRGLGHTGGTLDKFDSIPGYQTQPDLETLRRVTAQVGCAIIGQTPDIAPADKRFYGIRDVTGTVESVDLITASILSKKLAAGLDALILDVKVGTGAFMATPADADALAQSLVHVANGAGCNTAALITDMNEPLAKAAGNALEVLNACDFLTLREVDNRQWDVCVALGGDALMLSGLAQDAETGRAMISDALQSGRAAEKFDQMVAALGGPVGFLADYECHLPRATLVREVFAPEPGIVTAINTRAIGNAVVELGGGRIDPGAKIDHSVGLDMLAGLGDMADAEQPLCRIHAQDDATLEKATTRIQAAYVTGDTPAEDLPLLKGRIG